MLGARARLQVSTGGPLDTVHFHVDVSMRPLLVRVLGFVAAVWTAVVLGAPLLLIGDWDWWRAWVLIGVFVALSLVVLTPLLSVDIIVVRSTALLRHDDPLADRLLIATLALPMLGWYLLIPADVFHLELLAAPPSYLSAFGLLLVIGGMVLAFMTERANPFAAPAITHLTERDHHLIDVGPYRFIRHPMYAGGVAIFIGVPLWLESTAATLLAVVPIAFVVLRIGVEERFLQSHLDGYSAFMQRVRYRLVPHLW